MGTWGTAVKDDDAFADIYGEFYELYNNGEQPNIISQKIIEDNYEILDIADEKHSFWFALALAQWETRSLDSKVLTTVEDIIVLGSNLKNWADLGADEKDIEKRKIALDKFLKKLKSERPKAKPRKRKKLKIPIFETGECLIFKLANGNYGGVVVLACDNNPETGSNLIATTRLNQIAKPSTKDLENAEVLVCNYGQWQDKPDIAWHFPDLFVKDYSDLYESVGKIEVERDYDARNYEGKDYLFIPSYTAGWRMNQNAEQQFESEITKAKPTLALSIRQLTKKNKWWNMF